MKEKIDVLEHATEILQALQSGVLLVTKDGAKVNAMTISWGALGIDWRHPVFKTFVRESRFTRGLLDKTGVFNIAVGTGEQAKQVLEKNIAWIKNTQAKMLDRTGLPKTYSDGEKIMLLGEPLTIRYISGNEFFKPFIEDRELRVSVSSFTTPESVRKQIDAFIADLAFTEIQSCMKKAVELTGLSPDKVTVKPMTSSWGRCISNRHISINSKVVVFDRDCITYVCIHELCHLKEMNHSPQFWALVEKSCPDYKAIKQRMK